MLDQLGDRIKFQEQFEASRTLHPGLPICARLDGRSFHSFTKHAKRPFSEIFHRIMVDITRYLVEESSAIVGYTQSDEISLVWYQSDPTSQMFFGGNIQKLCSTLAATASARLLWNCYVGDSDEHREENSLKSGLKWNQLPTFDCRVWTAPSTTEATNALIWRQADARRNSVSMAASTYFSHKSLMGLTSNQRQEKLFAEKGINWDDYPAWCKRGTFIRRVKVIRKFTTDELELLPEKHQARLNPDLEVERSELREEDLFLTKIPDRVTMLFGDESYGNKTDV